MKSLSKIDGRYVLDCAHAAHLIRPTHALARVTLPDDTSLRVALSAPDRRSFLAALLRCLNDRRAPLLATGPEILERFEQALTPVSFNSAADDSPLASHTWDPEERLCAVLTSGSSGSPQTFEKSARQLFEEALALVAELQVSSKDNVLATTAFHHVYGLLFGVLVPWTGGAAVVAHPDNEPSSFHPEKIAKLVESQSVTVLVTVPAHLRALLEAPLDLRGVRRVVCSAAPLRPEDATRFENKFGIEVTDVLGSTETGGIALRRPAVSSAWRPLAGVSVELNGEENLVVRSPFLPDPTQPYVSDERARLNDNGTFEHLGRADGIVKVGGKRISLQEVKRVAESISGVTGALALSRSVSSLRGEELLLVLAGKNLNKEAIKGILRQHLGALFVPRKLRLVERLPIDERGKVKRNDALALFDVPADTPCAGASKSASSVTTFERTFVLAKDSQRFEGHFDADPLLPALAQLSDLILPEIRRNFGGGALAQLSRVKWTAPLRPGDEVTLRLRSKKTGIHFELLVGEQLSCTGTAKLENLEPTGDES